MRSCRPTRGPTSKPVLIVATTANAIGRAGRRIRPKKKPVRAGASPTGSEQQRHGGRRERGKRWATPAAVRRGSRPHDASRRAPAGADVVVIPPARREGVLRKSTARGVAAGDCSPVTASASRLAEQPPSVGEVAGRPKGRSALARIEQAMAPPSATKRHSPSRAGVRLVFRAGETCAKTRCPHGHESRCYA